MRLRQISERIPAGRWGQPQDFAGPVVFLASNASQYVCGELLVVDGVSHLCSIRRTALTDLTSRLNRAGWDVRKAKSFMRTVSVTSMTTENAIFMS